MRFDFSNKRQKRQLFQNAHLKRKTPEAKSTPGFCILETLEELLLLSSSLLRWLLSSLLRGFLSGFLCSFFRSFFRSSHNVLS